LHVPLLSTDKNLKLVTLENYKDLKLSTMKALHIKNCTDTSFNLNLTYNYSLCSDIFSLFNEHVKVSHHSVRLAHFRDHPKYFAPILSGNRYFLFHGDGFCTMLSMIFKGLCKEILGIDINTMYCRNNDFTMSHGYCQYSADKLYYIDPDLKTTFPYEKFIDFQPSTWFFNLIENVSIRKFHSIPESTRASLFFKITREYFIWLFNSCTRELSLPNSRYEITHKLFQSTLKDHSEILDLSLDDYPWKAPYRNEAKKVKPGTTNYFMQCIKEPVTITIEPEESLYLNLNNSELKEQLDILTFIFYGRIPLVWEIPLKANTLKKIMLPEIPWLLSLNTSDLVINGIALQLHKSNSDNIFYCGMGDFEQLLNTMEYNRELCISPTADSILKIYFPANASYWNSSLLKLDFTLTTPQNKVTPKYPTISVAY
jgi:hypothetical protein